MPYLTALRVYDNSFEANPAEGKTPELLPVLYVERGRIISPRHLSQTPDWAKPIVAAAIKASRP